MLDMLTVTAREPFNAGRITSFPLDAKSTEGAPSPVVAYFTRI
jgi:hypothetical protein